MIRIIRPLLVAAALIASGCTTLTPHTPSAVTTLEQQQLRLQNINNWQFDGKLGVRSPYDSGSASIKWQQFPRAYNIHISGPLGQKRMHVQGEENKVSLHRAGQPSISADNAEALLQEATGWNLPISQLSYWVRGLPAPKLPSEQLTLGDNGLIAELQQAGWHISYTQYAPQQYLDTQVLLPSRIQAVNDELRLTLVIRTWQLGNAR